MKKAAEAIGVELVTGDTKVVDKGKGDGIFINTAGIGIIEHDLSISPQNVQPNDAIIISGDVGRHGIAIMAEREGLAFESTIESDLAPVASLVQELIDAGIEIHCLRDLTRGGLASALVEIAETAKLQIEIDESSNGASRKSQTCGELRSNPYQITNPKPVPECSPINEFGDKFSRG